MEKLDIKIKPRLQFSLKKCGDVVPYGITPEEKQKIADAATVAYVNEVLGDIETILASI